MVTALPWQLRKKGAHRKDTKAPKSERGWFAAFLDKHSFVTLWLVVSFSAPARAQIHQVKNHISTIRQQQDW